MSTFDGIVEGETGTSHVTSTLILTEFPEIRIDYFRKCPERPAPLACFLSHVHSDHLQGLESFRAPFIYCSPATRELLLRIEKYPHRMNFNKGILESRRLHYKHLAKLLRPIPLNTPTEIELTPRRRIKVTLLDANHCTGAVMFLIEGDGKAIIYTGDIRAETWWVSSLVRHPVLIPYTLGQKRLDKLYLDSTFANKTNPFREFPSKAEGLSELLQKVQAYPDDTVFYFRAWTFGYEDVWIALSAALNTKIHVDRYQMGLYQSLIQTPGNKGLSEAPALCGFELGNKAVAGCLSNNESSRIHSCEPGVSCSVARSTKAVYIVPIVNRTTGGAEIPEVGAGGGIGDLYQTHELELPDESALAELEKLCLKHVQDKQALSQMRAALLGAFRSRKKALSLDTYGVKEEGEISLKSLVTALSHGPSDTASRSQPDLPNTIRFPYSRHSSYSELCELVAAFQPKDIYPCTVDPTTWNEDVSIRRLFGHLCSGNIFSHDTHMRQSLTNDVDDEGYLRARKRARYDIDLSTQSTQETSSGIEDFSLDTAGASQHYDQKHYPLHNLSQPEETARAKRNEIRQAHRYLQEHPEPGLFQVNPLPSTWPAEKEDSFDPESDEASEAEDTLMPDQPDSEPSATGLRLRSEPSTSTKIIDLTGDGTTSPHPITQQTESQHTDVLSLSVSESAFDSPDQNSVENGLRDPPRGEEIVNRSRRARVAAYLAAREGTFSAWTDVSLVSAGDNHTEEEIEL
ncbi:DNA repair metallo-beta-lactamase [Penicillium robsamsonii]|uniref:DNA repair metallo-beta-lactamase n=1 Tax=Penicillium robsamsonii TaxID=1792511 RepID=UPI002546F608|nr:DNA repair metallo-beta-lactamase [Penicillium robsamsonii]KAJ5824008.1 DNA repair metallo-beta-lactamase [Penicillium robsamsonii]